MRTIYDNVSWSRVQCKGYNLKNDGNNNVKMLCYIRLEFRVIIF